MGVNPALPYRTLGHVFDSSLAAWIPDPKTSAGGAASTQVAVSSLGGLVSVAWAPSTAITRSSVTQSSTNVTMQAANSARRLWTCVNRPSENANLFVKLGATASTSDFDVLILPNGYYEMPQPVYTGQIDGIWDSTGAGVARVVEFT